MSANAAHSNLLFNGDPAIRRVTRQNVETLKRQGGANSRNHWIHFAGCFVDKQRA
jgi:hypothetical protein